VQGNFATWSFNKAGVRAPGEGKADGENSVMMKLPSQFFSTSPIYYNCYMAMMTVYNSASTAAKYSLEYSIDGGQSWTVCLTPNNATSASVPAKATGTCYWSMNLNNRQGATFRISQVGGNKNTATYVDNFTLLYTGDEGGPIDDMLGDVNGDKEVNVGDVNALIDIILGGAVDDDTKRRADVNSDKEINIADVNALIDIILNI